MRNYPESYKNLDSTQFKSVHIYLCAKALDQLEAHVKNNGPLQYKSTLDDSYKILDLSLCRDAILSVQAGSDIGEVSERYSAVKKAFCQRQVEFDEDMYQLWCSIINMYEKHVDGETHSNGIIIRQALINFSGEEFYERLEEAIEKSA